MNAAAAIIIIMNKKRSVRLAKNAYGIFDTAGIKNRLNSRSG